MKLSATTTFALETAREASALVMRILPESWDAKETRLKSPTDLVTRADHESERLIAARIHERFPDHAILGEEGALNRAGSRKERGPRWLIDPVDGTTNFAHGVPWFAVSIGLESAGAMQCGVVAVPPLAEYFVAERGRGAFLIGPDHATVRLAVSGTADLRDAIVASGLPGLSQRDRQVRTFALVMEQTLKVRIMGAAAIHLAYVAAGRLDGFWECDLNPWDIAAGVLLVEEAGGRVTGWGRPFSMDDGDILASNGLIHDQMTALLSR